MADFALEVLPTNAVVEMAAEQSNVEFLTVGAQQVWKNSGYYAAGAVWEVWETSSPNATPPSGHALIGISSYREA